MLLEKQSAIIETVFEDTVNEGQYVEKQMKVWEPAPQLSNPVDPEQKIPMVLCNIHNFKSIQNLYLQSQPGGIQDFMVDFIHITWETIVQLHLRRKEEIDAGVATSTCVAYQVTYPISLTLRSVSYALQVFEFRILKEQCVYLAKKLGCINEMLAINHGIGYEAETVDDWVKELKEMATEKGMFEFLNADKKTK
jgi:hypothetical protein